MPPAPEPVPGTIVAAVESKPAAGDADDPAVWVHPVDPALSLVIGTDKEKGLAVYDLSGKLLQFLADGTPNNVDLRDGFPLGGQSVPLVVAADDSGPSLRVYRIDPESRRLVDVTARPLGTGIEAHGLCLYRSPASGKFYAFPNEQKGGVEQWELFNRGDGRVDARLLRGFTVRGDIEGCVADDHRGTLFVGQEDGGIWRYGAEPDTAAEGILIDRTGGDHLTQDVEGLAILDRGEGTGYLIASSQGDSSFAVYRRDGNQEFVTTFRVSAGAIDGCEDTDGIEVVSRPLGPRFPDGIFVCHDGENDDGNTNFKFVPLAPILAAIGA